MTFPYLLRTAAVSLTALLHTLPACAQDDPVYFRHDFEDKATYPSSRSSSEQKYDEPYGEWIYVNASSSTNSKYLRTGMGERDLRMTKNSGSSVVLPVLDRGAKELCFMEGRGDRSITVYTSEDGGKTWTLHSTVTTDNTTYTNHVTINSIKVNRIKLANEGSADADVDNIYVTILTAGTKATMLTGEATEITKTDATVGGEIVNPGDKEMIEWGVCWSTENTEPSTADNKLKASATPFDVRITGLEAETTVYYRAYAITGAGTGYGDARSFKTADATPAVLTTTEARLNSTSTDHKTMAAYTGGIITDDGGASPATYGVVYSTTENPTAEKATKALGNGIGDDGSFNAVMRLLPNTTYFYRAFATTKAGTAYGDERSVTTGELVIPDFDGQIIHCSPAGNDTTGDGSEAAPFFSLQKAADMALAGDTIYMMAGTYVYDARININHSGKEDAYINVVAKGGRAILDFSAMPYHSHSNNPYQGIRLCGSYWHFYRIDITNASDNGMLIERNKPEGGSAEDIINATDQAHDNIIEECNFYRNGDSGLQLKNLAANNRIINCDAYLNCDEGQGDADGFAPKLSVGDGNYFYGCRAWFNSDDGWDVFFKKEGGFGDNKTVILEECLAYKNGFLDENTIASSGNGNGFKMGSDQGAMNVYMNRCLAVCNKAKGFDQNHNAGDIILNNCTGMTLKSISDKAYSYRIYESIAEGHSVALTNCIAINDNAATDKIDKNTGLPKPGEEGKYGEYGRFQVDTSLDGLTTTTCEFSKASPTEFTDITNHAQLIAPRNADGSLPYSTFAHIKEGSFLIDKGTPVSSTIYRGTEVNGIAFNGTAPDLGAYETSGTTTTGTADILADKTTDGIRLVRTHGGNIMLIVSRQSGAAHLKATVCDYTGKFVLTQSFSGTATLLHLPQQKGIFFVCVEDGKGWKDTAKFVLR